MNIQNIKFIENIETLPSFYLNIVNSWIKIKSTHKSVPNYHSEIRKEVIWGNKFVKFQNKSLVFKNWIDSNLIYLNDILDENGRHFAPVPCFDKF